MSRLTLNSYAKLNLYLEVLNRRNDNYHNIKTIFERIDLCDRIILKTRPDKNINIVCNSPGLPKDNTKNLAYRSAKLLQDAFNIDRGVDIKIIKRIPVASGLGGGSSNAAVILTGLNKLYKLQLSRSKMAAFARKIGSDVPFFIYNTPFAKGEARGDKIRPLKFLNKVKLWHILVVPKKKVSTVCIYKKWDAEVSASRSNTSKSRYIRDNLRPRLTSPRYDVRILNLALRKRDFVLIGRALFNSLEQVTTKSYPQLRRIKEKLSQMGVKSILMSGSGPAIFGMVSSRKEAVSLYRQLKEELKKEKSSCQVYIVCTR